jgi:hypothetical protein
MTPPKNTEAPKPDLMAMSRLIWVHPRRAVRQVVDYNPWLGQKEIIAVLCGVSGLLALPQGLGMMALEILLNLLLLIISIYPMAWLLWLTGKPMGGKASFSDLCAAMVWPMIPAIAGTLLAIPLLGMETVGELVQGVFYLYSFHIMVQTVAEVQGFNGWQSFLNQLFALILSLLPLLFFWQEVINLFRKLSGF